MQVLRTPILLGLAAAALAAPLRGQNVLVVDPSGAGDFTTVQDGVLAAQDGDHLLVRAGTYGPVEIAGKGLSLVAERGAQVSLLGGVRIASTLETHVIHLSGLQLVGSYAAGNGTEHGLLGEIVRGPLRLQDCALVGAQGLGYTGPNDHGGDGAHLVGVLDVAFVRCTLFAGDGGSSFDGSAFEQRSGHGLWCSDSSIVLQDCELEAGDSMEFDILTCDFGGQQGHGAYVLDSTLYASGTRMEGGLGGTEGLCAQIFPGGDGLRADGATTALVLDCDLIGGPNNVCNAGPGEPSQALGGATIQFLPGQARSLGIPSPSEPGDVESLTVEGEPGDFAWLLLSFDPGYRDLTPVYSAPLLVGTPLASPRRDLGFVSATGQLQVPVIAPGLPQGSLVLDLHAQLLVREASGAIRLAGAQRWTTYLGGLSPR